MATIVNVDGLSQDAKKYQKELRFLPFYILMASLEMLGIGLMQVSGIDTLLEAQRKGGLLRPYDPANISNDTEIMKFVERDLAPKTSYISMLDNIKNYVAKKLLNVPQAGTGINQTKKHPLEDLIVSQVVRTATEDVLDALFPAERNTADQSPLGAFDGFDTLIDSYVLDTQISAANGNLKATGAIIAPVDGDDTSAIDKIVDFVRQGDNMLLKNPSDLLLTQATYTHAVDALENKFKYKDVTIGHLEEYINGKAGSRVKLKPNRIMGTGDRLVLQKPFNFHFGMDTFGDVDFVQVRNVESDPNIVQFWLQADFGTRIASLHKKTFMVNDGTPVATELSGDYQ